MSELLALVVWLVVAGFALLASLMVTTSVLGKEESLGLRLASALIALLVGQYLLGLILLTLGAFRGASMGWAVAILVSFSLLGLLKKRVRAATSLDLAHVRWLLSQVRLNLTSALIAVAVVVCWLQVVRGFLMPRLDWDFFTYHGPRAVFWLQDSALWSHFEAPGAWQLYRALPPAGDLLTAWTLGLAGGNDCTVPLTWVVVWLGLGLSSYAGVRMLDAPRSRAALTATFVVSLPAVFHHSTSGYIDNATALAVVAGTTCFLGAEKTRNTVVATLGLLGLSIASAIKPTAGPFAVVGALLWCWMVWRYKGRGSWWVIGTMTALASASAFVWPLLLTSRYANPLYPFGFKALGLELIGAPPLRPMGPPDIPIGLVEAAQGFFLRGFRENAHFHNGFGLGGALLILVGVIVLVRAPRRFGLVLPAFAFSGLTLLVWVLTKQIVYQGLDEARYLVAVPVFAAIAVGAAGASHAPSILAISVVLNLWLDLPWRWSGLDVPPVAAACAIGAVSWLAIALLIHGRGAVLAGAGPAVILSLMCAGELRGLYKWDYFKNAANKRLMNSGLVFACPTFHAYPIWKLLEDSRPLRLAVTAGEHHLSTHWYIYPIFGGHLQHRLQYVPTGFTSNSEATRLTSEELDARGRAWIKQLRVRKIDGLVLYQPYSVEHVWVERFAQDFERAMPNTPGGALYWLR